MKVVCGTDFSENAAAAVRAAAALATRARGSLDLVHVARRRGGEDTPEGALAELDRLATSLRERGISTTTRSLEGVPDEELVTYAASSGAALLVVGALGERSQARWFVGGTAERVAQTSPVPVLVVRSSEPFEAWAQEDRPLRLLVGAEPSPSSDAAVRFGLELGRVGPCRTTVLHIYWPPEQHARLGIKGPMSMVEVHPEVESVLARELAARFDAAGTPVADLRIEQSFGRIGDALALRAARDAADLVVVGTRQRSGLSQLWHGSVSCAVLDAAATSVACVPVPAEAHPVAVPAIASVLAPTDFSDVAERALGHAFAAVDDGGWVHLLHVHETGEASAPNPLYAHYVRSRVRTPEERRRLHADLAERLTALVPAEAARRGIRTQVHVIEAADAVHAIVSTAELLGVSLICMGSHGRSRIARAFLGSVAQGVVAASRSPVLVVPVRETE